MWPSNYLCNLLQIYHHPIFIESNRYKVTNLIVNIVEKFGNNPLAMKQAGIAYATEQIIDLIANGVKNIHLYTMNKPDIAATIMSNLSEIINKWTALN